MVARGTRDFDRARAQATELDAELEAGQPPRGPLHGLPLTVKESLWVEGLPTSAGDPQHAGRVALQDGDAVR